MKNLGEIKRFLSEGLRRLFDFDIDEEQLESRKSKVYKYRYLFENPK